MEPPLPQQQHQQQQRQPRPQGQQRHRKQLHAQQQLSGVAPDAAAAEAADRMAQLLLQVTGSLAADCPL